ncbi:uncharacterized protein LOC143145478 [Ptiloglossa arizonensis]|uniref:uncharacterized protein LOC143145478 n=1 Tax=Ptiloglossa arizonensis TaxID=3350558 RepID=UPI003FA0B4D6
MDTKKQIRLMTGIQDILATSQAMYGRCYLWSCKEDKKQQISTILAKNLLVRTFHIILGLYKNPYEYLFKKWFVLCAVDLTGTNMKSNLYRPDTRRVIGAEDIRIESRTVIEKDRQNAIYPCQHGTVQSSSS